VAVLVVLSDVDDAAANVDGAANVVCVVVDGGAHLLGLLQSHGSAQSGRKQLRSNVELEYS